MSFNDRQVALTSTFCSLNSKAPIFLQKLYKIVDSPETNDAISWSDDGESLIVCDHERLARDYLPQWFKHNKYPSFVRQLNNYGFHKVPNLQQGVMKASTDIEQSQYAHPYFRRGKEDQLILVRPIKQANGRPTIGFEQGSPSTSSRGARQQLDMHAVLNGIATIRKQQTAITQDLDELKRSDQLLWEEALQARNRHTKLQDTVNRIVKFLATLISQPSGSGVAHPQPSRLMIEDSTTSKVGEVEEHDGDGKEAAVASALPTPSIETPNPAVLETPPSFTAPTTDFQYTSFTPSATIDPSIVPQSIPSVPPSPGKLSSAFDGMSTSDWDMFSSLLVPFPSQTDFSQLPLFDMGQSPPRLPLTSGDSASTQPLPSESLVPFDGQSPGSLNKSIEDIDNAVSALDYDIDFLSSALGISSDSILVGEDGIDYSSFFATPPLDIPSSSISADFTAGVPGGIALPANRSRHGSLQPDGQAVDPGGCPPTTAGIKRKLDTTDLEPPPVVPKPPPASASSLSLE
ncbi:HSF-type DNA-binding-domain-containing protein [Desarmillaria ectypa]|nr:HSF-type DNA-binding-domain-containing protein [Desarmillaria ectypa]